MIDSDSTIVNGEVVFYTPERCIERAVVTFFSGLTEQEKEQARKTFEFSARQVTDL